MFSIPCGVQQSTCAIVGAQIGAGNVPRAKQFHWSIFKMMLIFNSIEFILVFSNRMSLYSIFTNSVEVKEHFSHIVSVTLMVMWQDFYQTMLCGTIKAIGRQGYAAYINFVTYYVIIIPLAFCFTFKLGSHINTEGKLVSGQGVRGLWFAFIVGMTH